MNKIILSLEQVNELVRENRYKVDEKRKFISRCIDGRYENEKDLPALAFPGADLGELIMILSAGNFYGFEVDFEKARESLINVIGGEENYRIHTDSHADPKVPAGGCGHWKQINLDSKGYDLNPDQIELIKKEAFDYVKKFGTDEKKYITLQGEHLEGAVLLIKGKWGVYPQLQLETDYGKRLVQVFIYHQSLVDERHRALAKELIKNKAVIFRLDPGLRRDDKESEDENWLYNALSDISENHLMETSKRLAKGLPIYQVIFEDDGGFDIKEQGTV